MHYLTLEDVAEINERFVEPDGLADIGLLESAVLRPQTSAFGQDAYGTIHDKAGASIHSFGTIPSWMATSGLPSLRFSPSTL